MLLAFEAIEGDSLDRVGSDAVTDDLLDSIGAQVVTLQDHGIAHRDLRLADAFVAADGALYVIDLRLAETAASPLLRATVVSALLQPYALGGAARAALKEADRLAPLRAEVERRARIPEPDYHGTVPASGRAAVLPILLGLATTAALIVGVPGSSTGPAPIAA